MIALAAILAASCSGATAPRGPAGTYALSSVEGSALPAPVFDGVIHDPHEVDPDFHLRIVATSGQLTLSSTGHYEHAVQLDAEIDGQAQPAMRWRDRGTFAVRGDTLQFDSDYHENVFFHGALKAQAITVVQDLPGEGQAVRYTFTRE